MIGRNRTPAGLNMFDLAERYERALELEKITDHLARVVYWQKMLGDAGTRLDDAILAARKAGVTVTELAGALGSSEPFVYRRWARAARADR